MSFEAADDRRRVSKLKRRAAAIAMLDTLISREDSACALAARNSRYRAWRSGSSIKGIISSRTICSSHTCQLSPSRRVCASSSRKFTTIALKNPAALLSISDSSNLFSVFSLPDQWLPPMQFFSAWPAQSIAFIPQRIRTIFTAGSLDTASRHCAAAMGSATMTRARQRSKSREASPPKRTAALSAPRRGHLSAFRRTQGMSGARPSSKSPTPLLRTPCPTQLPPQLLLRALPPKPFHDQPAKSDRSGYEEWPSSPPLSRFVVEIGPFSFSSLFSQWRCDRSVSKLMSSGPVPPDDSKNWPLEDRSAPRIVPESRQARTASSVGSLVT
mmetsp:Transcript_74914/g.200960  ORF Transcript_74914/g.200960 Transcript_74914/m.200960 type:complete len:328 (+) Transcript_74914:4039-5022(+)